MGYPARVTTNKDGTYGVRGENTVHLFTSYSTASVFSRMIQAKKEANSETEQVQGEADERG